MLAENDLSEATVTLAHKKMKNRTPRVARKNSRVELDTQEILKRIEEMVRELQDMRHKLVAMSKAVVPSGLTDSLFGAAGHGIWEEYDMHLDWKRFSEWQTR